jgi:cytochrome c oxidase subunit 2
VDAFLFFLLGVAAFFSLLVGIGIFYLSFRYRRRADNPVGELVPGSSALEAVWMVVPLILAMFMFGWGAKLYVQLRRPPKDAMEIFVVGKQWMWKIQHSEGRREFNELHVPLNRDVQLTMTSEDVIHDFFVPAFRVKMDVLPGRYTSLWFRATKRGRYHLFCSQYCGTNHALMGGWVVVMEPAEYQAWLSGATAGETLQQAGERLFTQLACVTCHAAGPGQRGPSLRGVYGSTVKLDNGQTVTADEAYLRESILNPRAKIVAGFQPVMPVFQGTVSEDQVLQLIAYIKSLAIPLEQAPAAAPAPKGRK